MAEAEAQAVAYPAELQKPASLRGRAGAAWNQFIAPATWLDRFREPAAIIFCHLWAEFLERPAAFKAAKHAQMRGYMADLGLTDERNRRLTVAGRRDDPGAEYLR